MTYEQRAAFYRRSVDRALADVFEHMARVRDEGDYEGIDDETLCMVALRSKLRALADEAEARINMQAQLRSLLDSA